MRGFPQEYLERGFLQEISGGISSLIIEEISSKLSESFRGMILKEISLGFSKRIHGGILQETFRGLSSRGFQGITEEIFDLWRNFLSKQLIIKDFTR